MLQQLPPMIKDKKMDSKDLLLNNFALEKYKSITIEAISDAGYKHNDVEFGKSTIDSNRYRWNEISLF